MIHWLSTETISNVDLVSVLTVNNICNLKRKSKHTEIIKMDVKKYYNI